MLKIQRFEDLIVWQEAIGLAKDTYQLTSQKPLSEEYALCGQIKRSAISISANIAEGFEYKERAQFRRFLRYAMGSCAELRSLVSLAFTLGFMNDLSHRRLVDKSLLLNKRLQVLHYKCGLLENAATHRNK